MNSKLVVLIAVLLTACSTSRGGAVVTEEETSPLPADYFDAQQRCVAGWRDLIIEWRDAGGSVLPSVEQTRRSLEQDKTSRLARVFRHAWCQQKKEPGVNAGLAFATAAEHYMAAECTAYSGLGESLPNVDGVMEEGVLDQLARELPGGGPDQPTTNGVLLVAELVKARSDQVQSTCE